MTKSIGKILKVLKEKKNVLTIDKIIVDQRENACYKQLCKKQIYIISEKYTFTLWHNTIFLLIFFT